MHAALQVVDLLGALGVFLFGMKIMSEGLQKVAGQRLKELIGRITGNRISGVITGFSVTSLVQSSSATTVMLVGFVNAGLLTLHQAIGVIMGANIGTTVTGWLVALLGFKVSITAFALPAIGLGVAMTFLRGARRSQLGEVLIGFGLLFLGLSLMKDSVPGIQEGQVAWVQSVTESGFLSTLLFVALGTAFTVVLQSSSATMTLTLTLTASGFIPYDCAAAMVLGENIGTTATANIAAIGTSTAARRAARAHLLFNLFGVAWALATYSWLLLPGVDALVPGDPTLPVTASPGEAGVITAHLAAFHTVFNVVNTLILLPFVNHIAALVTRLVPERVGEVHHVAQFISSALVQTPEFLLVQVGKEMQRMTEIVREMYHDALRILAHPESDLGTLVEDTLAREQLVDDLEHEISAVLAMTARAASSATAARQVGAMVLNTHRLERIADHCEKLVHIAVRNHQAAEDRLEGDALTDIAELGALVDRSLDNLSRYLVGQSTLAEAERIERSIDTARSDMRSRYLDRMRTTDMKPIPGMWLLDIISHLEEIGDRAFGIIRRVEATRAM